MHKKEIISHPFLSLYERINHNLNNSNWIKEIHSRITHEFSTQPLPKSSIQALLNFSVHNFPENLFLNNKILEIKRKPNEFIFEDNSKVKELTIFGDNSEHTFLLNKIYCHETLYRNIKDGIQNKEIILKDGRYNIEKSFAINRSFVKEFLMNDYQNNTENNPTVSNLFSSFISDSYQHLNDPKYQAIFSYHKILNQKQIEYIFTKARNRNLDLFFEKYNDFLLTIPKYNIKFSSSVFLRQQIIEPIKKIPNECIQEKNTKLKIKNQLSRTIITRDTLENYMNFPIKNKSDVIALMEELEKQFGLNSSIREKNKYRAIIAGIIKKSLSCYVSGETIEQVILCGNNQEHELSNGDMLTFDHLFPQCFNGINGLINGMPMSSSANSRKSDSLKFESIYGLVTISPIPVYNIGHVREYISYLLKEKGYSKNKIKNFINDNISDDYIFSLTKGNDRKKALLQYSNYYRVDEILAIEKTLGKDIFNKDDVISFLKEKSPQCLYGEYKLRNI